MPNNNDTDISQRHKAGTTAELNGEGKSSPVALSKSASGSMVSTTIIIKKNTDTTAASLKPISSRYCKSYFGKVFRVNRFLTV